MRNVVKTVSPMSLLLNEDVLRNCYGLLHCTEPFCHWGLPDKHDVSFAVTRSIGTAGDHCFDKGRHTIRISRRCVGSYQRLGLVMGHEMIHVAEVELKTATRGASHNRAFLKMSDEVCFCHGFDRHDFAEVE